MCKLRDQKKKKGCKKRCHRGGMYWEVKIDIYTLQYLKYVTNKNLLYSTGNSAQYSAIT